LGTKIFKLFCVLVLLEKDHGKSKI